MLNEQEEKLHGESSQPEQPKQPKLMSRRKMLTALGLAGVSLASAGLLGQLPTASANAPETDQRKVKELMEMELVVPTTIAELRALVTVEANARYYVKDAGQEGFFYYDPLDTVTPDNTGIVLQSAGGARFKRIFQGRASVKWFGAKGDGVADDREAIAAAVNCGYDVFFPKGTYVVGDTIELHHTVGMYGESSPIVKRVFDLYNTNPTFMAAAAGISLTVDGMEFIGLKDTNPAYFIGYTFDTRRTLDPLFQYWYFYLPACSNIVMMNCTFRNIVGCAVTSFDCKRGFYANCNFEEIVSEGIASYESETVYVDGCKFKNIGLLPEEYLVVDSGWYSGPGVTLEQAHKTVADAVLTPFMGNIVWHHFNGTGVVLSGRSIYVGGCDFLNCNRVGIVGEDATEPVGNAEMVITGNTVEHNHERLRGSNPPASIWVENARSVIVSHNRCVYKKRASNEHFIWGINLAQTGNGDLTHMECYGNQLIADEFNNRVMAGIMDLNSNHKRTVIRSNRISGNVNVGIFVAPYLDHCGDEIEIEGNHLNIFDSVEGAAAGIYFNSSWSGMPTLYNHIRVAGNWIYNQHDCFETPAQWNPFFAICYMNGHKNYNTRFVIRENELNGGSIFLGNEGMRELIVTGNTNVRLIARDLFRENGKQRGDYVEIANNTVNKILLGGVADSGNANYRYTGKITDNIVLGAGDDVMSNRINGSIELHSSRQMLVAGNKVYVDKTGNGIVIGTSYEGQEDLFVRDNTIICHKNDAVGIHIKAGENNNPISQIALIHNLLTAPASATPSGTTGIKWLGASSVSDPIVQGNMYSKLATEEAGRV